MATTLGRLPLPLFLAIASLAPPGFAQQGAAEPAPTPAASEEEQPPDAAPWLLGGLGVLALGVGGTFGVLALSSYDSAEKLCPTHKDCSERAMNERERADTAANLANGGITIGIIAIGLSAYVLLTGVSSTAAPKEPILSVSADPKGRSMRAVLEGRF
jgi:hypothetical protein